MMFYIPPLSPVMSTIENNLVRLEIPDERHDFELLEELDKARLPIKYLANLFSIGDEVPIRKVLRTMLTVRTYKRRQSVDQHIDQATLDLLESAGLDEATVEAIYKLTTIPTMDDRFVFPPYHREMSIEELNDPLSAKGETGFGVRSAPQRGA
jgi:nitrate reductase beta subunit